MKGVPVVPPRRPSMLMTTTLDKNEAMTPLPSMPAKQNAALPIVYVSRKCTHSLDLAECIAELEINVEYVNVDKKSPPEFVIGTPTLWDSDGTVYCGDACFAWAESFSKCGPKSDEREPEVPAQDAFLYSTEPNKPGCSFEAMEAESLRMLEQADKAVSNPEYTKSVEQIMQEKMAARKSQ